MPAKLLGEEEVGGEVQREILAKLKSLQKKIKQVPGLAVIAVDEDPTSPSAVYGEEELGKKLGYHIEVHRLSPATPVKKIRRTIRHLNDDEKIQGIFCRFPLSRRLTEDVLETIVPDKDVGGMHPLNTGMLWSGVESFIPCSAYACLQALEFTKQPVHGKTVVLLGRSNIVSKPLAHLLLQKNATITMCPALTDDLPEICRSADILISEIGKPGLVKGSWIKAGAAVIDAGVTRQRDGAPVGDVVLEEALQVAEWVFPLPAKEAGTLVLTMLMKNTLKAFVNKMV